MAKRKQTGSNTGGKAGNRKRKDAAVVIPKVESETGGMIASEGQAVEKQTAEKQVAEKQTVKKQIADAETADNRVTGTQADDSAYQERLKRHHDELRWLYMELYGNDSMFAELLENLRNFYLERNESLKGIDAEREKDPDWYRRNDMLGMMLYIDNFAGTMKGVESRLDYI